MWLYKPDTFDKNFKHIYNLYVLIVAILHIKELHYIRDFVYSRKIESQLRLQ